MSGKRRGPPFTTNTSVIITTDRDWVEVDGWLRVGGHECRVGRGSNCPLWVSTQAPRVVDYGPRMLLGRAVTIDRLRGIFYSKHGVMPGWEPWARFLFKNRTSALLFKLAFGGSI